MQPLHLHFFKNTSSIPLGSFSVILVYVDPCTGQGASNCELAEEKKAFGDEKDPKKKTIIFCASHPEVERCCWGRYLHPPNAHCPPNPVLVGQAPFGGGGENEKQLLFALNFTRIVQEKKRKEKPFIHGTCQKSFVVQIFLGVQLFGEFFSPVVQSASDKRPDSLTNSFLLFLLFFLKRDASSKNGLENEQRRGGGVCLAHSKKGHVLNKAISPKKFLDVFKKCYFHNCTNLILHQKHVFRYKNVYLRQVAETCTQRRLVSHYSATEGERGSLVDGLAAFRLSSDLSQRRPGSSQRIFWRHGLRNFVSLFKCLWLIHESILCMMFSNASAFGSLGRFCFKKRIFCNLFRFDFLVFLPL